MKSKNSFEAICFDYYGTLVKIDQPFFVISSWFKNFLDNQHCGDIVNSFTMHFNRKRAELLYCSKEFLNGKLLLEKCYLSACTKYGVEPFVEEFTNYITQIFTNTELFEGVRTVLERLRRKFTIGLLTNADNDILLKSLKRHDLSFEFIFSSESAGYNKPDKRIFQFAMKELGLPPDKIWMVGDSLTEDIEPAKSAGMKCIWKNHNAGMENLSGDYIKIGNLEEILLIPEMRKV